MTEQDDGPRRPADDDFPAVEAASRSRRDWVKALGAAGAFAGAALIAEKAEAGSYASRVVLIDTVLELKAGRFHISNYRCAIVFGYHVRLDQGGGVFVWVPGSAAPDDGGMVIAPSVSPGTGRWVRMHDGDLSVRWFGATGDGSTDDLPAFRAAIEAMGPPTQTEGVRLMVPPGTYRLAGNLVIDRKMILSGASSRGYFDVSKLLFDDSFGVIIAGFGNTEHPSPRRADHAAIEHLSIVSANDRYGAVRVARPDGSYADGVYMKNRAHLEHCSIVGFAGHGIHIWGYDNGSNDSQNCNDWTVRNCFITNCRGWAMYVHGSDSNAGLGLAIECISNGLGGIYDSSFLGCTWIGCHIEANYYRPEDAPAGPAFKVDGHNSTLIGCYSENDLAPSQLGANAIAIGGDHGAQAGEMGAFVGFSPDSLGLIMRAASAVSPMIVKNRGRALASGGHEPDQRLFLGTANGLYALGWDSADDPQEFALSYGYFRPGWWDIRYGLHTCVSFSNANAPEGPGQIAFQEGFRIGYSTNGRKVSIDNAPPTSGTHQRGDRVLNRDPTAGGYAGWICVADGSPGTWKGFGLIET